MLSPAMKRLLLFAVLTVLTSAASGRTFTNQKGKAFEGTLLSVDSTSAEIMSKEGKKYKVPLEGLSAEDQKFCMDWRAANPAMKLTVKAEALTAKGTRQTNNESSNSGSSTSSTSTTSRTRTLDEGYRITVSNWSSDPGTKVSGLKVEYAIVVGFTDTTAKDKRGVKEVVKGTADLPEITGTKPQFVETKTVKTGQTAAVASRTIQDSSGDSSTASAAAVYRESMDGIYLVVKHGDRIVATHSFGKVPKEVPLEMSK